MANTFVWKNVNSNFADPANWTDTTSAVAGPPVAGDTADIDAGSGAISGSGSVGLLEFTSNSGAGNWTVTGALAATSLLSQDPLAIAAGGTITVTNGTTLNASTTVSGALIDTNPGFSLAVFGVGAGTSTLTVTQGGTVTAGQLRMHNPQANLILQPGAVVNITGATNGDTVAGPIGGGLEGATTITGAVLNAGTGGFVDFGAVGTPASAEAPTALITGGALVTGIRFGIGNQPGETSSVTVTGAGTVLHSIATASITAATGDLNVGGGGTTGVNNASTSGGTGSLLISAGALGLVDGFVNIGQTQGTGGITVAGGSTLTVAKEVRAGDSGPGTFAVVGGSTLLAGASLDISTFAALNVGDSVGAGGSFLLSDPGSSATLRGQLVVGNQGTGSVTIGGGAAFSAGDASRATSSGIAVANSVGGAGSLLITGAGTRVTDTGRFAIGRSGTGSLVVSGGAVASSTGNAATGSISFSLGANAGASGSATITGAGSALLLSGGMAVGGGSTLVGGGAMPIPGGTGSLAIAAGGVVTVAGGANVFAAGSVSLSGGALQTDALTIAGGGNVSGSGTLSGTISDLGTIAALGGLLDVTGPVSGAGTLTIQPGATLQLDGAIAAGTKIVFASGGSGTLVESNPAVMLGAISGTQAGDRIVTVTGGGANATTDTVLGADGVIRSVPFGTAALATLAAPLLAGTAPASTLFIDTAGSYAMAGQTAAIDTAAGAVTLTGNGGANETIAAGAGSFFFQAGAGESGTIIGGGGADSLLLGGGGNWFVGLGNGADTVVAATGNDTVSTGSTGSFVFLGTGVSSVASFGADTILGGSGSATVSALGGADELFDLTGPLTFIGGNAASTVVAGAAATVFAGAGNTLMFGNGQTNYIAAGGVDTVVGLSGSLTVAGGAGGGLYFGGAAGNNQITAGTGAAIAFGGGSGDVLTATGSASDLFAGGVGSETLTGAGSTGNNTFFAGFGPETLVGGAGNTALVAGAGQDLFMGGTGLTLFLFTLGRTAGASDTISGFDQNHDFVQLGGYAGGKAAALATASVSNGAATIALSDGTHITFTGVTQLNAGNFV